MSGLELETWVKTLELEAKIVIIRKGDRHDSEDCCRFKLPEKDWENRIERVNNSLDFIGQKYQARALNSKGNQLEAYTFNNDRGKNNLPSILPPTGIEASPSVQFPNPSQITDPAIFQALVLGEILKTQTAQIQAKDEKMLAFSQLLIDVLTKREKTMSHALDQMIKLHIENAKQAAHIEVQDALLEADEIISGDSGKSFALDLLQQGIEKFMGGGGGQQITIDHIKSFAKDKRVLLELFQDKELVQTIMGDEDLLLLIAEHAEVEEEESIELNQAVDNSENEAD